MGVRSEKEEEWKGGILGGKERRRKKRKDREIMRDEVRKRA